MFVDTKLWISIKYCMLIKVNNQIIRKSITIIPNDIFDEENQTVNNKNA